LDLNSDGFIDEKEFTLGLGLFRYVEKRCDETKEEIWQR